MTHIYSSLRSMHVSYEATASAFCDSRILHPAKLPGSIAVKWVRMCVLCTQRCQFQLQHHTQCAMHNSRKLLL